MLASVFMNKVREAAKPVSKEHHTHTRASLRQTSPKGIRKDSNESNVVIKNLRASLNTPAWQKAFANGNAEELLRDATKIVQYISVTQYGGSTRKAKAIKKREEVYFSSEESLLALGLLWCYGDDRMKAENLLDIVNP